MGEIKWMQDGPYGIMVHYLSDIKPKKEPGFANWEEMTRAFDVKNFADQVEKMGAKWVIFPFGQNSGHYCSPNSVLDSYVPGCCSTRDLMMEIAVELQKREIRLIAYLPSEMDAHIDEFRDKFGWDLDLKDKSVFHKRYEPVIEEWAKRFGTLISGWWFDGCYNSYEKDFLRTQGWDNTRFDYARWKAVACAGNPDAVIAMCPGAEAMKYVFKEQDYLAGEINTLNHHPEETLVDGMQLHGLLWLDCFWGHWKEDSGIETPRFTDDELWEFYQNFRKVKGGITWNIGIYQDGTMAEKTVDQIIRLKNRGKTNA